MKSISKKMKIKSGLVDYDPSESLRDPEGIFETFMDCLREGDDTAAVEVLSAGLRYANKSRFARRHGISRRTLYNFLGKSGSPSLELVAKVCRALLQESPSAARRS
jgi:probable addiction module antidote protein